MKTINQYKGFLVIYLIVIVATFGMVARVNIIESNGSNSNNLIVINE